MEIEALYNELSEGNRDAKDKLFERLSVRFGFFAGQRIWSKQDAEEVAQTALMIVLKKCEGLRIETSFTAWAHKVLEYEILRYFKKKAMKESRFGQLVDENHPSVDWDVDPALQMRLLECLRKIGAKNRNYARILNLHYQGYSVVEVTDKLGMTANNSYVVLSRARSLLVNCLEEGDVL